MRIGVLVSSVTDERTSVDDLGTRGGDARPEDIAVIGTESDVESRLRAYADAGATEIAAAPIGFGDDARAGQRRTLELLASLDTG